MHIGLTQKWYIASFSSLFESFADVIYKNLTLPEDQALALRVCNRLLSLEQQVVLEAYDDQLEIVRESEVRSKAKVETIAMLEQTSNELATHSQQTNGLIQEMTARMDIIAQNAKGGRVLAEEAQQTANDGNTQLDKINRTIERVEESSRMVGEQMKNLEMMTNQIKDIVGIVKGIADQTNLLSLNASIEAARAGEHGKGAAVVASEVRKLAEGTRDSVMNVSELVNKINEYVASSSSSLEQAQTLVEETKDQMNGTRKSFKNILQTMENTKESNVRIEQDLESFLQAIYEIEQSAATLATTAENLNVMMEELNE
ncbi:methyl-accepting chemotaxis protein [Compostibacillus humi]|uniref:methyl-accepting chemotaxis protein n=1 Tax=Compostibacillus humi TaxID=1245525 RepID=UPI00166A0D89|nr:methyl-accepting chemotaxis protein [Compostibacillus humi]